MDFVAHVNALELLCLRVICETALLAMLLLQREMTYLAKRGWL